MLFLPLRKKGTFQFTWNGVRQMVEMLDNLRVLVVLVQREVGCVCHHGAS